MNDIPSPGFNPHGSREQVFREHEHIFSSYMRTYPKSLEVQCGALVPESLASRLRKIAHELMHYRWETSFSITDFELAWRNTAIRVSMARTVVIGPKKGKIELATPAQRRGQAGQVVEMIDDEEVLWRLMFLHHRNVFKTHTHIQSLKAELATWLEEMLKADALKGWDKKEWNLDFRRHPSEPGWILG